MPVTTRSFIRIATTTIAVVIMLLFLAAAPVEFFRVRSQSEAEALALLGDDVAGMTIDAIERWAIEAAIARAGGTMRKAAQTLGFSPSTLHRKRERRADATQ